MKIYSRLLPSLAFAAMLLSSLRAEMLPQNEPWMQTLRNYLGTLQAKDFVLDMAPVEDQPEWVDTVDKAYPVWMALCTSVPHQPLRPLKALAVFRMKPEGFLLKTIEADDGIRMAFSKDGLVTPMPLLWWEEWDYPGNPYRGQQALLHRAFVMATVDLLMFDALIRSGTPEGQYAARTSFVGGRLVWKTYTYLRCKAFLPPEVAQAYEKGLERALAHLEAKGPDALTDNMNGKTLVAMAYLSQAMASPEIAKRAEAYAARICGARDGEISRQHPAGVIRDASGIETSYNGLYLHFLTWAAAAAEWPLLREALDRNYRLKSLMTLPEPDGANFYGPSHFNVRVSHDSANDQWSSLVRDMTAAMISPAATYLVAGSRRGSSSPEALLPPLEQMQTDIAKAIARLNAEPGGADLPIRDFERFGKFPAKEDGAAWVGYLPFFTKYYRPGTYEKLRRLADSKTPAARPPAIRGETFSLSLPDKEVPAGQDDAESFLFASRPSYYLVVYTGRLGHRHPYMNWGGGGISAWWTPQTGSLLLGRSAGYRGNSWKNWRNWPVNALSGITEFGDAFSTALLRRSVMEVRHEVQDEVARSLVTAKLNIGTDKGKMFQKGQLGELIGNNDFTREIKANAEFVQVTLRLSSDRKDKVRELFETLPVFLKDLRWQKETPPTKIEILVAGEWRRPGTEFTPGVSKIRLARFAGSAEIEFDRPRGVRLSPSPWSHLEGHSEPQVQSVQIDLLDGADGPVPFPSGELVYRIRNTAAM